MTPTFVLDRKSKSLNNRHCSRLPPHDPFPILDEWITLQGTWHPFAWLIHEMIRQAPLIFDDADVRFRSEEQKPEQPPLLPPSPPRPFSDLGRVDYAARHLASFRLADPRNDPSGAAHFR